jgi:hypothetical protein
MFTKAAVVYFSRERQWWFPLMTLVLISALILSTGCASMDDVVVEYTTPKLAEKEQQDRHDCQIQARAATHPNVGESVKKGGVGALIGGAVGAAAGAIGGSPEIGAAAGGLLGASVGGLGHAFRSNDAFRTAMENCMERKGHAVIR